MTPTPIPELFVIQDGALLAWDASLGEYQAVVLSNGALPEGAQIIQSEIVASDGAVLYRFDLETGAWVGLVPADIQDQVQEYFGVRGTLVSQEGGVLALMREDGSIMAQETEAGWFLNFGLFGPDNIKVIDPENYPNHMSVEVAMAAFKKVNKSELQSITLMALVAQAEKKLSDINISLENVNITIQTFGDFTNRDFSFDYFITNTDGSAGWLGRVNPETGEILSLAPTPLGVVPEGEGVVQLVWFKPIVADGTFGLGRLDNGGYPLLVEFLGDRPFWRLDAADKRMELLEGGAEPVTILDLEIPMPWMDALAYARETCKPWMVGGEDVHQMRLMLEGVGVPLGEFLGQRIPGTECWIVTATSPEGKSYMIYKNQDNVWEIVLIDRWGHLR